MSTVSPPSDWAVVGNHLFSAFRPARRRRCATCGRPAGCSRSSRRQERVDGEEDQMPTEQEKSEAEHAVVDRQLHQGLDLVAGCSAARRAGLARCTRASRSTRIIPKKCTQDAARRPAAPAAGRMRPGRRAPEGDGHRQMQTDDLGGVDHVIEPLAVHGAAAAQPGQLAVRRVEGVARHEDDADQQTEQPRGRAEGDQRRCRRR